MSIALAAATAIGAGINAWQSRRNVVDTNRANVKQASVAYQRNKELAQYTYDKNVEMWKMQNQYNAPGAQMQRLQEAGLNPHLMYGKGTVGNAQAMPQMQQTPYVAPRIDYTGRQSISGSVGQAGLGTLAQMLDVENKKLQLRASELGIDAQQLQNGIKRIDLEIKDALKGITQDKAISEATTQFYNEFIKSIEADRYKYGIEGAQTEYKIFFEYMNAQLVGGTISNEEMYNITRNMALTKVGYGVAKDVLGGALFAKFFGNKGKAVVNKNPTL
jgi:hypothetical protein